MNIAIIGAGVGGLAAARRALQANIGNVTVFEQSDQVGGMWVYTDKVGLDEFGLPIHNSMYHGLVTNAPKEIMALPGVPFDAQEMSYLRSDDVLKYLQRLAATFNLESLIRFRHRVTSVRPLVDTTKWSITAKNLLNDAETTGVFDAVFVCNGHYSVPAFPDNVTGRSRFRGLQLHSHEYRRAERFAGKSVLIIGSGPSGTDIAWLIKPLVRKLAISVHAPNREKIALTFGAEAVRPDVAELSDAGVTFADASTEAFDVILYCTGYRYEFPFLAAECGIDATDCHVRPLFKQCIHMERPTMFFVGLTSCDLSFLVMDTQVRVALRLLRNEWQLPALAEMQRIAAKDLQRCWERGYNKRQAHRIFDFLPEYLGDLTELADLEPISPVIFKIFDHAVITTNTKWKIFRTEKFAIVDSDTFTSKF